MYICKYLYNSRHYPTVNYKLDTVYTLFYQASLRTLFNFKKYTVLASIF